MLTCELDGCDKHCRTGRHVCSMHESRMRLTGTYEPGPKARSLAERLWSQVDKTSSPNGCWLWTGGLRDGYGYIMENRNQRGTHRVAWELTHGTIPPGMQVDHMCHVKNCVNPSHLQVVTPKQNVENFSSRAGRGASGVRGVHRKRNKWQGCVTHFRKVYSSPRFNTIEEAAEWVRQERLGLHSNNLLDRQP